MNVHECLTNDITVYSLKKFKNLFNIRRDINVINSLDYCKPGDLVLLDYEMIQSFQDELHQREILYDLIDNWTNSECDIKKLNSVFPYENEYIDPYENRFFLNDNSVIVSRAISKGKIIAKKNFFRDSGLRCITGNLKIVFDGCNGYVRIGNGTTIKGAIITCGSKGRVEIGEDSMFARNIEVWENDGHPIYDINTNEIINSGKNIYIGNHVWLGRDVCLLGGASIPDGCILGARSVTSSTFDEGNCIIAGSPAKVIRTNVEWKR